MAIIRQSGEGLASTESPAAIVGAARAYFRKLHEQTAGQKDQTPLLGQFAGLGFETKHVPSFIQFITGLGDLSISHEEARKAHARLDRHRRTPADDPEQRISPEGRAFIMAATAGIQHPALQVGECLQLGLSEERSPAVRLADEAVLALRLELAARQLQPQPEPEHVTPAAA